jgi:hypothetical protein
MRLVTASLRLVARALVAAGLLVAMLIAAAPVLAHAELVSGDPAPESILAEVPAQVSATFDDDLDAAKSSLVVIGPDGSTVGQGSVSADDPRTLVATLTGAGVGAYEVRWTAAASDGDVERGTYTFTVSTVAPSPTSVASATASPGPTASPASPASTQGDNGVGVVIAAAVAGLLLGGGIAWWRRRQGAA